ncbi:hypothetical protein DPMN_085958 [Dreissena polymorpha]|uniref:Uncharacterized protein n=1 Tax=Dreissena polymorpha TaxID=45954 RepID=A0A9D4BMF5_DREPO|nr:hypothetical protein DPMN_085958 [Dreissena polymorpha]
MANINAGSIVSHRDVTIYYTESTGYSKLSTEQLHQLDTECAAVHISEAENYNGRGMVRGLGLGANPNPNPTPNTNPNPNPLTPPLRNTIPCLARPVYLSILLGDMPSSSYACK